MSFINSLICRVLPAILCLFMAFSVQAQAPAGDPDAGKTLFKNNCASCHNRNMKDNLTGPALGGVEERWASFPREDLYSWIRNSQAMINSGHPRAVALWEEWKPALMNNFQNLTDEEIEHILAYVKGTYDGSYGPVITDTTVAGATETKKSNWPYIILAGALTLLALLLARITSNLSYLTKLKAGETPVRSTLAQTLTSKRVISVLVFGLVVLGGYTTVNNAIKLGRQQGYQPEQPIKFSHVTHAGIHKIDCQYCHDGARRSKQSVIPAANTCMNCHKAIKQGSQYGTAELTKIYASVGYDPSTDTYIENYDKMSQSDIERVYKKWIADSYVKEAGKLDEKGEELIETQWKGIVTSLTDTKNGDHKIQGPIEWVRIHNLADHAYFNHAQHVSVGKVECQTCHGKVEEMEVVKQYSPLSMGWCINCHRETEVQFKDNAYYESYERYHKELKSGKRDKVTVEDIGGLECQKCHY